MLLSVFVTNKEHNSLVSQNQLLSDYYAQTYTVNIQELDNISYKLPNLSSNTIPIATYIARYRIHNNDYEKALKLLNYSSQYNPYDILTKKLSLEANLLVKNFKKSLLLSKELFTGSVDNELYAEIYFSLAAELNRAEEFTDSDIILYSENKNSDKASEHIKKYIKDTQDLSILNDHVFSDIKGTEVYSKLTKEYKPHFNFLSLIHALTGIIGVFIVIILFAKRNLDKTSVLLIGSFILFHSFFMLHISLFMSNYNLMFPHSFYISTPFSFLYGPLLYFYFKRVVENYKISIKMLYI